MPCPCAAPRPAPPPVTAGRMDPTDEKPPWFQGNPKGSPQYSTMLKIENILKVQEYLVVEDSFASCFGFNSSRIVPTVDLKVGWKRGKTS